MNKTWIWVAAIIIIIIGGVWYYQSSNMAAPAAAGSGQTAANFGTYNYECDEHVTFSMTPSSDMSSIQLQPTGSSTFPPAVTVVRQTSASGVLFTGGGVTMSAHGETVTLGTGDSAINCSPQNDPDQAPLNFGD